MSTFLEVWDQNEILGRKDVAICMKTSKSNVNNLCVHCYCSRLVPVPFELTYHEFKESLLILSFTHIKYHCTSNPSQKVQLGGLVVDSATVSTLVLGILHIRVGNKAGLRLRE